MTLLKYLKSWRLITRAFFIISLALSCAQSFSQANFADSFFSLAKKSLQQNNYAEAIRQYQTCLPLFQKQKNWLNTGNAYNGIGIANNESGNYEEALTNYFKGLQAYEKAGNEKKQAGALKNIGNVYRTIKSYDKSKGFLETALAKYYASRDSTGVSGVLNDIGIMYMELDSSEQAIYFFKKVIYTYRPYAKPRVRAFTLNNLAITYSNLASYQQALKYYNLSLAEMKKLSDQYGIGLVLGNLGAIYNRLGDYSAAIKYNRQAMDISAQIDSKELQMDAYENLSDSYRHLKNFRQAYAFLKKHISIKDTIFSKEKAKNYVEMETKYQNEKKQKEILRLQQEKIINNLALADQKRTKYFLLSVLVFISLLFFLLYRNFIIKQNLNKELNVLNARLNEANRSKTKVLSIISHDLRSPVSSLFSFLQYQKRNPGVFTKEKAEQYNKQITASAENLLEAMEDLLVWSKSQMDSFKPSDEEINVSGFLDEIIQLNANSAYNKNIELLKECPQNIQLHTDPNFLKIILRNLTSNAIKFTPACGIIHLSASKQSDKLNIVVKDNGEGIPPDHLENIFEWNSIRSDSSGLGLKLAKEFTEKLQGSIAVVSEQNKGTQFIISFPG